MNHKAVAYRPIWRTEKLIALELAGFTILLLVITVPQIGLTWDEPTYIVAAETYPAWYGELVRDPSFALSPEGVAKYWEYSHEHPPLSKVWSGFVWLGARRFLDDLTAHRLGNILMAGVLVALLYNLLAGRYGHLAGLVAAFALLTMPRFFFHAHLAALDVPVTAMIFGVTCIFWLGHERPGWSWTLLLGLAWGLALATKINALFISPIVLLLWTLLFRPRRQLFVRLVQMGCIGAVTFVLCWPWFYHDLSNRLESYIGFMTTDRLPVEQYYFGSLYAPPAWHFPFVMAIIVVPVSIILLATVGAFYIISRRDERPFGGLILLSIFVSLAVFSTGQGQVFDNERLIMPVFPYLAALAGVGFVRIVPVAAQALARKGIVQGKHQLVLVLLAVTFAPHLILALDLYPHLLSYYSEAIGGAYGAHRLRLETTYWCETYSEVLTYLNTQPAYNAVVWAECQDVLVYYQLHGRLRPDLQIANGPQAVPAFSKVQLNPATFREADYVVIQYRQSGFYRALREWMRTHKPVYEFRYRRLRLLEVYVQ
jgi:4-amino-4-deoxy-L-arabinose transferase-like glycosyltransferase